MNGNIIEQKNITLGRCLTTLYTLSKKYVHSMPEFFRMLFGGYHKWQGDVTQEEGWLTNQSTVSRIMRDEHGLTWQMRRYYILGDGDAHLRQDVQQYVKCVVQTAKQRNTYITLLSELIERSTNLDEDDKDYIIAYRNADGDNQLSDLIFRMLRTMIRYT